MVADLEAVEPVSEILSRVAPAGVSVEPAFDLIDEGLAARPTAAGSATVRAYIPASDPRAARRAADEARRLLAHLQAFGLRPIGELETRPVHEEDWAEAWKRHFPVLRIGRRLVIRPTWRRHRASAGDVVLALDPGMAFGTGLHPTTRLCLAALETLADRGGVAGSSMAGSAVLDVGCGSGILAIAAAKLGAASVVAVDTDPIAIEATELNARRNGLARVIEARRGSVPTKGGSFDLVLANLIASLLIDLAGRLASVVRPTGQLVASGIFVDREPEVVEAFERAGMSIVDRTEESDWVCLRAARSIAVR